MSRRRAAAALLLGLALGGCRSGSGLRPTRPDASPAPSDRPLPPIDAGLPGAAIRVGIATGAARVSVAAASGVRVTTGGGAPREVARLTAVALQPPNAASESFEVQVANVADEAAGRELAARAGRAAGAPAAARPGAGGWRVRVGPFRDRASADRARGALTAAGFADSWVVAAAGVGAGGALELLELATRVPLAQLDPLRPGEPIEVDGVRYRGRVELRPAPGGGVDAINALPLEDYLRGVVPRELSPEAFPELEALKAQAVAARSYAERHRGGYAARGYDICASPACQVYGGLDAEHPLSDRAVAETRGLVALYAGRPIDALYTSTCGGHTENAENIFSESDPAPWLRGVACAPERSGWLELKGRPAPGGPVSGDRALLEALGLVHPGTGTGTLAEPAPLAATLARLPALLGRRACAPLPERLARRGALFAALTAALCWDERGALLAPGEVDYLLPSPEPWPAPGERLSAALLVGAGVLRRDAAGWLRPDAAPLGDEVVSLLAAAVRQARPLRLREEQLLGIGAGRFELRRADGIASLPVSDALRLVRLDGAAALAVDALTLIPSDPVRLVVADGLVVYLEAEPSPAGPAWDRSSRYHSWSVTLTPDEVAERAAAVGWIGRLRDLEPLRRGVSGRVVEARLVGDGHERLLRGLEVRRALGLRESLLAVERDRDAAGRVLRFHFTGRGWGHGVGLCQVGAFGMARAGHGFEAILRHYYTGIALGPVPAR